MEEWFALRDHKSQNMKKALVVVRPKSKNQYNIGDYIQSLATLQWLKKADYLLDREELKYFNKVAKVIVNGCYQWKTEDWPPSETLRPLFISIHLFPFAEDGMFSKENIQYWINHSPIGCRDLNTLRMFQSRNIPAYFSACITLTLGKFFSFTGKRNGFCFVDPFIPIKPLFLVKRRMILPNFSEWTKILGFALFHPQKARRLCKKPFFSSYGSKWGISNYQGIKKKIHTLYHATQFYRTYSKEFTDEVLLNAKYITHMRRDNKQRTISDDEIHQIAKELINCYASSEMVVTSRIHAALPCLGLETPVIFMIHEDMESKDIKFNSPGRFEGIIDMMRCMRIKGEDIIPEDEILQHLGRIDIHSSFNNKDSWKTYAKDIGEKVELFIKEEDN